MSSKLSSNNRNHNNNFSIIIFQAVIKQKLLNPILQTVFPVLSAAPPPGEEDPEDEENGNDDNDNDNESPKHLAAQVRDWSAT